MRKVIMGIQGSGKDTQARLLADALELEHTGVGDIFRWNLQHNAALGAQVRRSVTAGELDSGDLVETVVHRRLSEHDWNYGFIIDGFPRNQPQAAFPGRLYRPGGPGPGGHPRPAGAPASLTAL
jgi:adenylate kinase